MTKEQLILELNKFIVNLKTMNSIGSLSRKTNKLNQYILNYTEFLNNFNNVKISERVYCLINNIDDRPKCLECQENYVNFINFTKGYREFCSNDCVCLSDIVVKRLWDNYKIKTGYNNPSQNPEVKNKKKETCLKNYGVESPLQSDIILNKVKNTNLRVYGHENPQQNSVVRQKTMNTNIELYGHTVPINSKEYQKIIIENNKELYGVDYYIQSEDFKKKSRDTYNSRTGYTHNSYNPDAKFKKTNLKNLGCEYPLQSQKTRQKGINTLLKKTGYSNPMQDPKIFERQQKSCFKSKNYIMPSGKIIKVQGYEPFALDILLETYEENQILTDVIDMPEIWYEFEGKQHRYFCDVFIPSENKLIEVKSDYIFEIDKEINLLKQRASITYKYKHDIWIIDSKGKIKEIK